MPEPLPPVPESPLSASDREAVVSRLSAAFANDVLPLDEFERRVAEAYRAASRAELASLLGDLPAAADSGAGVALASVPERVAALFGNVERGGAVVVPSRLEIRALFGNVELDLSEARVGPGTTEISIRAVCGNVELRLPAHALVENHGSGTLASFTCRAPLPAHAASSAGEPRVRVTGRAVLANVEIGTAETAPDVRRLT